MLAEAVELPVLLLAVQAVLEVVAQELVSLINLDEHLLQTVQLIQAAEAVAGVVDLQLACQDTEQTVAQVSLL
jgi:hypothetical protein